MSVTSKCMSGGVFPGWGPQRREECKSGHKDLGHLPGRIWLSSSGPDAPGTQVSSEVTSGHFIQEAPACDLSLILLSLFLPTKRNFTKGIQPTGESEFVIHPDLSRPIWEESGVAAQLIPAGSSQETGRAANLLTGAGRSWLSQLRGLS